MKKTTKPVNREMLYNEVWTEPVSVVAPRYGLSDVGLAKICRSLAIPLPSRGYWAKVKAGRIMKRVPLPQLAGLGQELTHLVRLPPAQAEARAEVRKESTRIRKESEVLCLPNESAPLHPLVQATSKRLHRGGDWPKENNLRSAPGEVLNISATLSSLDRALRIADTLLKVLGEHLFSVHIDSKKLTTILKANETGTELTFSLTEQIKRSAHEVTEAEEVARKRYLDRVRKGLSAEYPSIPRYDYQATGLLVIEVGRWPSRTWRDTPKTTLEKRLREVVAGILALAKETHAKEVEEARKEEERRLTKERYEYLVKQREAEKANFINLESQVVNSERAERIRQFADAIEQRRASEGMLTQDVQDWLAWARAKADWLDPLVLVSDLILDAPEPKKPSYYW